MIPKIIHYCWFGGNPKPALAKKCIKSWKKYCPDYELREWSEETFDIQSAPLYVRQAYDCKKWAFITDYVRLWAMYNFGGIYMDTDVEVLKELDLFLDNKAFSGFESEDAVPTGIMASEKGNVMVEELLHYYDERSFIVNGEPDITPNTVIITEMMLPHGLVLNNQYQTVNTFSLYPKEYFCPIYPGQVKVTITENTYTIHHFSGSWLPIEEQKDKMRSMKEQKRKNRNKALLHFYKNTKHKIKIAVTNKK